MPPITTKTTDSPPEKYYTDAPADYDWGWTSVLVENVATTTKGRSVRLVEIADGFHADYQTGRYASGLYFALSPDEYSKQVELGLLTPTPDAEVHHFRRDFDLEQAIGDEGKLRPYVLDLRKGKSETTCFESLGGGYRLTVKGKKAEAEAAFNRLAGEIEAILKG
jgi:hypothetical protein